MKKGFTLSEVLITLGIVGVISSLTIPRVVVGINNKVYVSQLQRTYNELRTAIVKYLQDNDASKISDTPLAYVSSDDTTNCPQSVKDKAKESSPSVSEKIACAIWSDQVGRDLFAPFLAGYLDVAVNCTKTGNAECVASSYTNMKGTTKTFPVSRAICVTLNSGASVCMSSARTYHGPNRPGVGTSLITENRKIYLDVNGKKEPNKLGRDAFILEFNDEGKIAESFTSGVPSGDASKCITSDDGTGCFTKIVADGWVMNY